MTVIQIVLTVKRNNTKMNKITFHFFSLGKNIINFQKSRKWKVRSQMSGNQILLSYSQIHLSVSRKRTHQLYEQAGFVYKLHNESDFRREQEPRLDVFAAARQILISRHFETSLSSKLMNETNGTRKKKMKNSETRPRSSLSRTHSNEIFFGMIWKK